MVSGMKCEFTADGILRVVPESAVEQFALSKWDQSKVQVEKQDHFFSMIDSSQQLVALINERKEDYKEFLRQRQAQTSQSNEPK